MRQRLARGQMPVDAAIDLHGMRQGEAHRALLGFVQRAAAQGLGFVLVVTGKGAGSTGASSTDPVSVGERGVLRRLVPHWLSDPGLRGAVIGFEEAGRAHGGSGALYVRLRRSRERGWRAP